MRSFFPPRSAVALKAFAFYGGPLVLEAVLPYLLGDKDCFAPVLNRSSTAGQKEQALRLPVAVHLLPDDLATRQQLFRLMPLLAECDRLAEDSGPAAGLVVQSLDCRVAEAVHNAHNRHADQPEKARTAETPVAVRQMA
jgi:hypothetical protein